jgi:hypothetical protein
VSEAQKLTGKLACLAEGANWVFHLLSYLYSSIIYALSDNKALLLESSQEFREIIIGLKTGAFITQCVNLARYTNFAMKRAARLVHHASYQYNINSTMRSEIKFFRGKLRPNSGIEWETPITHLIPRTPFATVIGDSSLECAGGFSVALGFWWHIHFPKEVIQRTLRFRKNNDAGKLISINVLEFITVMISYIVALHIVQTSTITDDPYPVILSITDNLSALSWTRHTCKRLRVGRLLARFFCSLLINSPLGINAQWISTVDNVIADIISRLKKASNIDLSLYFNYTTLKQTYPELSHCSFFQIRPELISLIWDIVLTKKWPTHEEVQILKWRPLGRLII